MDRLAIPALTRFAIIQTRVARLLPELVRSLALLIIALVVRLESIGESPYTTDEPLWLARAAEFALDIRSNPLHVTDHVAHPGIPPVIVMGISQMLAEWSNRRASLTPQDEGYVFALDASRVAECVTAALVIPLLYLLSTGLFSLLVRCLAALLFALDPRSPRGRGTEITMACLERRSVGAAFATNFTTILALPGISLAFCGTCGFRSLDAARG